SLSSCSYVCFALHSLQERSVGVVNFFVVIFCSGGQLLRYQKQASKQRLRETKLSLLLVMSLPCGVGAGGSRKPPFTL
ncbi:hypothetical protein, partial [Syntrophothermus sp.]|uniref:hypothetical protein n=1 Tax=Syntrophothermus sp. TaxID=2736299 RepID=UPI00257BFE75